MADPAGGTAPWPHRESVRVRYAEVDMQRVVFNAHYLTYCDEAMAGWMRAAIGWNGSDDAIDWMLVRAVVEWQGSAGYGDVIDVDCGIGRWGATSFDVRFRGSAGRERRPVFSADITFVCVTPGTTEPLVVPPDVRAALAAAPDQS